MLLFRWLVTLAARYPVAWRTRRGELGLTEDQRKIDQKPTSTAVDCRLDVVINNLGVVNTSQSRRCGCLGNNLELTIEPTQLGLG